VTMNGSDDSIPGKLEVYETVQVTAETHPHLHAALDTVSHDSGGRCNVSDDVPKVRWGAHLDGIEATLKKLFPGQDGVNDPLQTFCIGEESEAAAVVAAWPELRPAHALLDEFFESYAEVDLAEEWKPTGT
jgi:hypothetical protein